MADTQQPAEANGAPAARVDPSWKRVWQLPELRDGVQQWTLASDAGVSFELIIMLYFIL